MLGALSEDVLFLLDELGWAKAHVVGQSFGALLALYAAARHPERVASLVLLGASDEPDPPEPRRRKLATLELLGRIGPESLGRSAVLAMLGRTTRPSAPIS